MNIKIIFAVFFLIIGMHANGAIKIVVNNKANAILVVADQTPFMKRYSENLNNYIFKISATKLNVNRTVSNNSNNIIIRLDPLDKYLQSCPKDAFRFVSNGRNFYIVGKTAIGLEFGIYQFLEEFLNVSWLMPTEIGEYIEKKNSIEIPEIDKIYSPDFKARLLSPINPLANDILGIWGRRNKLFGEIQFHHNMDKISGAKFKGTNQPDFGSQEFYNSSYKNIDGILNQSEVTSFSLGINDSKEFNFKNNQINSLGLRSYSDTYYSWVSNVVNALNKKHKNITYGLLAYYNVFDPPTNISSLPSNVIPYITVERSRWGDKNFLNNYKRAIDLWKTKAKKLGIYDYNYGYCYLLPRIYTTSLEESIQYHYLNNFEYYYSEAYPNFIEGPKYWILAKMLWSTKLDAKSLEEEWARKCVGKNSSVYLLQFYKVLEDYWSIVFKEYNYQSTFLPFNDLTYLNDINESTLKKLDFLLQKTLNSTSNDSEKARATVLIKMWDFQRVSIKLAKDGNIKTFMGMKGNATFKKNINDLNDPINSITARYFRAGLGM
ncbi:DUF4838 domain-containing protein [Sphingobacterium siyangense]|uniref:Uncharacterized protein DUF4838 n=1 Tax=Sphingobacterium siyangense TaxID=459529 RepID=A0A562MJ90_9SPHI|nr:DUF4838 domain-containing protein [Sphingobacterium siyangense]TWI19962.1 uncharacterized protein DUF4838 [Sphingobacterium siyangense]